MNVWLEILAGMSPMQKFGVGMLAYCIMSVAILLAYRRTRIYPLYLLKIAWISLTIIGFLWLIAMSMADPGPKHGGVTPEFMKNPAGPFLAIGNYGDVSRELYHTSPWWLMTAAVLMLLWRGLSGSPLAREDSLFGRRLRKVFLAVTALVLAGVLAVFEPAGPWRFLPAGLLLATSAAFVLLRPLHRFSAWVLAALGVLIVLPLGVCLARFDWSHYTYAALNYAYAWNTAMMGKYVFNSVLVSLLTVSVTLIVASMAAYALARLDFVGRNTILYGFIASMVIPGSLYVIPLFLMVQQWQVDLLGVHFSFMDSRLGLSLIYAAADLPFTIFLLTGFYRTLPGTLREAAAIDGCGEWRMFTDVFFPLALPGLATAAIFQFLGVWNEYQFALIFLTNDKLKTLPVGLYNLSVSQQYAANWSALFAGVTILCLPTFLIFVLLQERIVAGLTVGAVKE